MTHYYPYDMANPVDITNEEHVVTNGQIRLRHVPLANSIIISGMVEKSTPNALQFNEFYCWYSEDSLYRDSNRLVYFNALKNNSTVRVSYKAVGTVVTADDMNEIKLHMENTDAQFVNVQFALNQHRDSISDLQSQIQAERNERIQSDNNLQTQINNLWTRPFTLGTEPSTVEGAMWLAI